MKGLLLVCVLLSQVDALRLSLQSNGVEEVADSVWPFHWKKVAIAYSGHHYKIGPHDNCPANDCPPEERWSWELKKGSSLYKNDLLTGGRGTADFRLSFPSHEANIFKPLADHGVKYDIYFHTWPSPISDQYLQTLKPKKYIIEKNASRHNDLVPSPMAVLSLIEKKGYDAIILTRPDLNVSRPLNTYNIDPSKINLPNKEVDENVWRKECMTSDLMRIFPANYLDLYLTGQIDLLHHPIKENPWIDGRKDEFGCPYWRDHFNLMSDEWGASGAVTPIGQIWHQVLTDEHGPYYNLDGPTELCPEPCDFR